MAKIIKVGSQTITPNKIAGTFKTSRNSTTNPFKCTDFEGNTLPFEVAADVFAGTKLGKDNKLKMIAASVTGSMNKMRNSVVESVSAFVNKVRTNVSNAWDYAKNTNISDIPAIKSFNDLMNTPIEIKALDNLGNSLSDMKSKLAGNLSAVGKDINECLSIDVGKAISERWSALVAKAQKNKYSAETPVVELEAAFIEALKGAA